MKILSTKILISLCFCLLLANNTQSQPVVDTKSNKVLLPNGWTLTPAGKSLPLGDLPLNIAVSNSKKLMAVTNNGQSDQSIYLIDVAKQKVIDTIIINMSWLGLKFSHNDKYLYASGGNLNWIFRYEIKANKLLVNDTFKLGEPWRDKISPAGLDVDDKREIMYVVTKEDNSLYVVDLKTKKLIYKIPVGDVAYTCLLSPDNKWLYVSCWGCRKVKIYDTKLQAFVGSVVVGDHPNDMCINKKGTYLYVANANDNTVSVIDLIKRKNIETLNAALYPNAPSGSTTNSVALSDDEQTLYIANADNNCLAVFNVIKPGSSKSKGFIPTGWYPTCVRVINKKIYVANGKGFSSYANPYGPNPINKKNKVIYQGYDNTASERSQYIGGLFWGTLSIINTPDIKQQSLYSQQVYKNTPYHKENETLAEGKEGNPIPKRVGDSSPIKHVFYIIKENRTYDQILGDMPAGNGDTNLVLFGEKYTPNEHAIAREFVLLDNFYVNGEVSADGHNWSMGAYATDYLEKTWPSSYGGRGGTYDAEGGREIANNKNGFLWDFCKRFGVTYRTYGEFADNYKANIPVLEGHICPYFTSWDQSVRDTVRFNQWKRDFDSLLSANSVPQLNTLRFINDHTVGLSKGGNTPFADVADNDLAVGLFVEYLSKSKIWDESAIFIVEDDAQNGPDHVDAHRSTAYVAGGFVKHGFVDHTMYSTSSALRTMELILGLPPMSQYDAGAVPMWRCFEDTLNHTKFTSRKANVDLNEKNTTISKWSKMSDSFDFTKEDMAPDQQLNEVLWAAVKGENTLSPSPVHAAFIKVNEEEDDD